MTPHYDAWGSAGNCDAGRSLNHAADFPITTRA